MKNINPLSAVGLLALTMFGLMAFSRPATAEPSTYSSMSPAAYEAVLEAANPELAAVAKIGGVPMSQIVDNKAPWANSVAPQQFGNWFEFDDAYDYVAATNWTVTLVEGGSGEADPVLSGTTSVKGGSLNLTGDTNDNDGSELDQIGEPYQLAAGDTLVFAINFTTGTDVTQVDLGFGIGITDTDWLGDTAVMSDGVFFEKNDGDAVLDLVFGKNVSSASDYTRKTGMVTLAVSTNYKVAFVIQMDPSDSSIAFVRAYVNDAIVYQGQITTDVPDDEGMCIKLGLQQGEATNLKTLQINSVGCAQSY